MFVSTLVLTVLAQTPTAPVAPVAPSGTTNPALPPLAAGSSGIIIRFASETCAQDTTTLTNNIKAQCSTCTVSVSCLTARAGITQVLVVGTTAQIDALTTAIRNGQVSGIPPTATIQQVNVAPNGQATPVAVPPTVSSPSAWVQVSTVTAVTCPTQAQCQAYLPWFQAGTAITCVCRAARQTGILDIIVSPAAGADLNAVARAAAKELGVCVNVYTPVTGLPPGATPAASACPGKDSKKGLLGLLGLLGLIPLLLCLLLCCLCCLRRRKAARDVHFATFDPAPPNVAMAPVPSVCAPAPCLPASVCAPAPICAP